MMAWLRRAVSARPADPFAKIRNEIVGLKTVGSGCRVVDAFFNLPYDQLDGGVQLAQGKIDVDAITDPVLREIRNLPDDRIGRARVIGLFWSRRDKIGGFGSPDSRTHALDRLADGRGTLTRAELTALLTTHRDVIGPYDYPKVAELVENCVGSGSAGDVTPLLVEFLTGDLCFERFPGTQTLQAVTELAGIAGLAPEAVSGLRQIGEARQKIKARQRLLYDAVGPVMRKVLDETARYDGQSRAINPHGAFRDALAAELDTLSAEDRGRLMTDLKRCSLEMQENPAWRLVDPRDMTGIDPRHLTSVSGAVINVGALERLKLVFTHDQSLLYLRACFRETSTRRFHSKFTVTVLRALTQGIAAPDAGLAAQVRNSGIPAKQKDALLARLCPDLSKGPPKEHKGTPLQKDLAEHRDRLRANMERLNQLWVEVDGTAGPEWTAFNHQLYPFSSDVNRYADRVAKAARLGADLSDDRAVLAALLERAKGNLRKLETGRFAPRSLNRIRAGLPEGEKIETRSIYWMRGHREADRDVFDAKGQPKVGLIARIEKRFLDELSQKLAKIDAIRPRSPLAAALAPLLPKEAASKATAAWKKQARSALGPDHLTEILSVLDRYDPDGRQHVEVIFDAVAHGTPVFEAQEFDRLQIKAMIWAAQLAPAENAARTLGDLALRCYARIPGVGQTDGKLGNACVYSLSQVPDIAAIQQLGRIRHRVAFAGVKKAIDTLLGKIAEARGLSDTALEELAAPDHGLLQGPLRLPVGPGHARIEMSADRPVLRWEDAEGKVCKSVPKALQEADAEGVKQAKATLQTLKQDLTAQKARLERLLRRDVSWSFDAWCRNYRDHGTLGLFAGNLLWSAEQNGTVQVFLTDGTDCEDADGTRIDPSAARIRLWHPLDTDPGLRTAWRLRLMQKGIVQPFRQVWRETFSLTDAERATGTYSNRFAGHVVRQHQVMALATENGWHARHRNGFDGPTDQPMHTVLADHGLQAEYWTAPAGIDGPTTEKGSYLYLVTDRLKVHLCDESAPYRRGTPVSLEDVPPRILSELLRDCDLFTSVASISLDPEWEDQGQEAEHPSQWRDQADRYWHWSHTAQLAASAETRRDMLALLLPKLKRADSFVLDERFLTVQGKLHSYRIHLGSAAVTLLPCCSHICIVPERGKSTRLSLPFDGDQILSLILSKALLLVEDDRITDPVILRQLESTRHRRR